MKIDATSRTNSDEFRQESREAGMLGGSFRQKASERPFLTT
jgi:hypothetical protein